MHTAECTNLDEIKEPLYIIIYVVYNLFLHECKPLYALEMNLLGYRLYIFFTFYSSIVFLCVVSASPE